MNSRAKGKRGERQWRDELRANGYTARRGQQFCGSQDSPDVICEDLAGIHFEVKAVERLNIEDAMEQARRDAVDGGLLMVDGRKTQKIPIVAHKRTHRSWLVTMDADGFFRLLRGDLSTFNFQLPEVSQPSTLNAQPSTSEKFPQLHGAAAGNQQTTENKTV